MGLESAYGPFRPAVYHSFVLREAGCAPQKGLPEHGLSKESKISQRIVRRDGGPVQGHHSAEPAAECRWKRPIKETQQPPTKGAVLLYLGVLFL